MILKIVEHHDDSFSPTGNVAWHEASRIFRRGNVIEMEDGNGGWSYELAPIHTAYILDRRGDTIDTLARVRLPTPAIA